MEDDQKSANQAGFQVAESTWTELYDDWKLHYDNFYDNIWEYFLAEMRGTRGKGPIRWIETLQNDLIHDFTDLENEANLGFVKQDNEINTLQPFFRKKIR